MTSMFDTRALVWAFNRSGYSINALAGRLDISNDTLEDLLRGEVEPSDLRVSTLTGLADLMGIPLGSLFSQPPPAPEPEDVRRPEDDLAAHAEQLIACLYESGSTPTRASEIAAAFDWDIDRLYDAAREADRRLSASGLRLVTSHGELTITPVRDHTSARTALESRKVHERGMNYSHYKAIYQLLNDQPVTIYNSRSKRRQLLGAAVNVGVITDVLRPSLTNEALEAFL